MVFHTRYGYFKYKVMPFGLSNALISFQGYINKISADKLNIFVISNAREIELQTFYLASRREVKVKKTSYKPKTLRFFINWIFH